MSILVDTHTHTVVSGHAFSTLLENIQFAANRKLEGIVVTEHSGTIPGTQPGFFMQTLRDLPREYLGVNIYKGVEANIIDFNGTIDLEARHMSVTEYAIASLHDIVIKPGNIIQNTSAMLGALSNPLIDTIGHPGNPKYAIDEETLVLDLARQNKLLEVNNHSFFFRKGSSEVCGKLVRLCKQHDVRLSVASDAHNCFMIGKFDAISVLLEETAFPHELIVNRNAHTFESYLEERKNRI